MFTAMNEQIVIIKINNYEYLEVRLIEYKAFI